MNAELKQMWVSALRSGEYKQGRGVLKSIEEDKTYTYCCLGVLCELYRKSTGNGEWKDGKHHADFIVGESEDYTLLPKEVVAWAGLFSENPAVQYQNGADNLSSLNDSGTAFEQIADLIEQQF